MAASKSHHRNPKPHIHAGSGTGKQGAWPVQAARAHFARLIDEALAGRPQRIRRRGKDVVVLLAAEDYDRLVAPRESLVDFFRNSPLAEAIASGEIDLERDRDEIRDLEL
ncbi:MAG: type II toxin-antitoxin system Phd/YefM family antitoxin [Geminicoccaceae bacterium]